MWSPDAGEVCDDGVDNDCDGLVDDEDDECGGGDDDTGDDDTGDDDTADDDTADDDTDPVGYEPPEDELEGGCECRSAGDDGTPGRVALLALMLAGLALSRRRG